MLGRKARKLEAGDYKHGTFGGYLDGCRCDECKAAQKAYLLDLKARKLETGDYKHGTFAGYTGGCRCDECKAAQKAYVLGRKARKLETGDYKHGTLAGYVDGCRCAECQIAQRGYMMQRNYGITIEEYGALVLSQEGQCASCGQVPENKNGFHIDHDHDSGQVRSLLCHGCNVAFGQLGEDPERIEALLKYALKWVGRKVIDQEILAVGHEAVD